MPSELRIIVFSERELIWAVYEYARRTKKVEINQDIRKIILSENKGQISGLIHLTNNLIPEALTAEDLMSILIFYCLSNGVPVPKKASRSLQLRDEKLALVMKLETRAISD